MPSTLSDLFNDMFVCPLCHARLIPEADAAELQWLACSGCLRRYPVQDGIPVLIAERAVLHAPFV